MVEIDVLSDDHIVRLVAKWLEFFDEFNYRPLSSHYLQIIVAVS